MRYHFAKSIVFGSLLLLGMFGNCSLSRPSGEVTRAAAALRSGDYVAALQLFESGLSSRNTAAESRAGLLQVLRETGQYRDAIKLAQEFINIQGKSPILCLEQGLSYRETGEYAKAEQLIRQASVLSTAGSPVFLEAMRRLGEVLELMGRHEEAEICWNRLLTQYRNANVKGSRPLANVAVAALRLGYAEDAKDIFMDATDPKLGEVAPESLADFGYLFLEKHRISIAIEVFRDCLKIKKDYPAALLGIALAKEYEGPVEAESYARAALQINPNFAGSLTFLAGLALDEENHDAALHLIERALAVNPADAQSLSLQAFCHYVRGDMPGFEAIEKKILQIDPSCGEFYYILAENLVSRRKYQEAVQWSRKAVELSPKLWGAHATLGMNLMRVGDLAAGRRAIEQAFEGDKSNVWAFNTLDLFDQMDTFIAGSSPHFTFLMSREDAPVLSPYAEGLAEEAYSKLSERYRFKPAGPVQIEVFPDHGGFAVRTLGLPGLDGALGVCFGKVVAMDSPRARDAGSFNWGATLWHEFAHVMTLQMTHYNIPRWFSEGLSVHEEHRAYPGWGDPLTAALIQAYKEGKLMKASELNAGFVRPQSSQQILFAYYQAGLLCRMIEEKFGFDKIRQALLLFAKNLPSVEVFRQTLEWTPGEMDEAYRNYLDSHFRNIAFSVRSENSGPHDKMELTRRLQKDPDDFWPNLNLGALLRKEGANSEAEMRLKKAQQLFPQYTGPGNPYEILARMYLEQGREEEALAQFSTWRQLDGISAEPLLESAQILSRSKNWAAAAELLRLSMYINPYNTDAQKKLGEAAMNSGQWHVAIAAYRSLLGLGAANPADAHFDLARALLAAGNRQEARREVLRSLEIAPRFTRAQELLLEIKRAE